MTGMQQIDAADYYVPRHAAWLASADSAGPEAAAATNETAPIDPVVSPNPAPPNLEPTAYQFPKVYAPPAQGDTGDKPISTEPKRFWRGRKPGGSPRSISS